jgi:prepilin-type N-terminal cleavage/methylation domain-containing protein
MRKSRGFNLIEVMIALGVMSVAGYYLISMLRTSSIGQKTLLAQDEARILTDNMANILSSADACQYTLGDGAPIETPAVPALTPAVNAIPDGTYTGTPPSPNPDHVFPISKVYDSKMHVQYEVTSPPTKYGSKGIQLKSITIGGTGTSKGGQRWTSTGPNIGMAVAEVEWEQTGGAGASTGPQSLKRFFMVYVTNINTSTHAVTTCTAKLGGSGGGIGSGVANYLALWGTDTSLKESKVFQDAAGNVGIGTVSPLTRLDVAGTGLFEAPHARITMVDTSLGSVNTAPNWGIDNLSDRFRIFREPNVLTPGTEFLSIANNGSVGIATSTPAARFHVNGTSYFTDPAYPGRSLRLTAEQGGGGTALEIVNGQTWDIGVTATAPWTGYYFVAPGGSTGMWMDPATGNLIVRGTVNAAGTTLTSDARLKTNVRPIEGALQKILRLSGVSFDWISSARKKDGPQVGVIAQDVQREFPELVKEANNPDATSPIQRILTMDYSRLSAVLLQAVKEFYASWRADSDSVHVELRALRQENAELRHYLCGRDPGASLCRARESAAR